MCVPQFTKEMRRSKLFPLLPISILYKHTKHKNKQVSASTSHERFETIDRILHCLCLSLSCVSLLFPLITVFSGLLFKRAKNFSQWLAMLSNKLDRTLWPCVMMQFPYIILSKLHLVFGTYFKEQYISHFYEVETIPITTTNETCLNRHYNFSLCQSLAKKISKVLVCCYIKQDYQQLVQKLCTILSRLILPGKFISDIPEEAEATTCTDKITSNDDQSNNAIRVVTKLNLPLSYLSELTCTYNNDVEAICSETANDDTEDDDDTEVISFATDKLPDTKEPLCYQYCTDFNRESPASIEEIKQETSSNNSHSDSNVHNDNATNLVKPTLYKSSCKVNWSSLCTSDNIEFCKGHESIHLQSPQSAVNKQKAEIASK